MSEWCVDYSVKRNLWKKEPFSRIKEEKRKKASPLKSGPPLINAQVRKGAFIRNRVICPFSALITRKRRRSRWKEMNNNATFFWTAQKMNPHNGRAQTERETINQTSREMETLFQLRNPFIPFLVLWRLRSISFGGQPFVKCHVVVGTQIIFLYTDAAGVQIRWTILN